MPLILLSFTPFAAFTLLGHFASVELGLWAAAVLALGLVLSDWLRPGGSIKVIEAGSAAIFCALALYSLTVKSPEGLTPVRMLANGGLFFVSLLSLANGKPFTLQYSRETASTKALNSPMFLKENYRVAGVWVGNDDNQVLGHGETGGTTALPIWGDYMKVAAAAYPNHDFQAPTDIEFRRVDKASGLLADANTVDAYFQPFRTGTAPERTFSEQTVEKKARQAARDDTF